MSRSTFILPLFLVGMVGIGGVLSFRDYRAWRYEEMKNFGHGPGDLTPPVILPELTQVYKNDLLGLRIRLPEGWMIKEQSKFISTSPLRALSTILPLERRFDAVQFADRITLSVQRTKKDLPDFVNFEAGELKDRLYVSSTKVTFTMVQYSTKIVAYTQKNGVVYIFVWDGVNDGTFEAVLKTAIIS